MPYERIPSPASKTAPTPPATHPPAADEQPKESGEAAPRSLGVWLVAAAVFAVAFAGVFFLPNLRDTEPVEPGTRPVAPAPARPEKQKTTEDPDAVDDSLHPAAVREPLTPGALFAKSSRSVVLVRREAWGRDVRT
jgi:hypothetical protein